MPTSYPGGLDSFTNPSGASRQSEEVGTRTHSEMHADVNDAVEAIEAELGTDPSGAQATVKARIAATETVANAAYAPGGTDVAIADGGTGASTAAAAFTALKQNATDSATGVVELATTAEATSGTDTSRAVTPAGLSAFRDNHVWFNAGAFCPPSTGLWPARLQSAVINGGAAGNLTVTNARPNDELKIVLNLTDLTDLTSEFTISADNTINNAGGTNTTGKRLLVQWQGGYDLTGLAFDHTIPEKGALPSLVPASWSTMDVYIEGIALDSGTVRLYLEDFSTYPEVDVEVTAFTGTYALVAEDVPTNAVSGAANDVALLALHRAAGHANDDLAVDFCVLGGAFVKAS